MIRNLELWHNMRCLKLGNNWCSYYDYLNEECIQIREDWHLDGWGTWDDLLKATFAMQFYGRNNSDYFYYVKLQYKILDHTILPLKTVRFISVD